MTRMGIIGSEGRMGRALQQAIRSAGHELAGGIDKNDDGAELASISDILVDFSAPIALEANLAAACDARVPILIGTTGLASEHYAMIEEAVRQIAVLQTGNTSLGVTMLAHLVRETALRLGEDWDIEIVEMHHRMKRDAPSGTALLLGEAAAEGRGIDLSAHRQSGRDGETGARKSGDIGFAALRGGTVAGDHSVVFAGEEERVTLSHNAENRMIFARGAVRAAAWLVGKPAGRYTMNDVLDL